jgi:arylsulfatase A-like enzyme
MLGSARTLALIVLLFGATACAPVKDVPPRARHVVVVSLDTLGAKHMGAYGHARVTTPTFDALTAEGTLFERAYTSQTHTLTAHISLMTGLYPQVHGATEKRVAAPGAVSLAELLEEEGFKTIAYTTTSRYTSPRFGLGRGFASFESMIPTGMDANLALHAPLRAEAARAATDPGHRLFLFMHYYDAHSDYKTDTPYTAPSRYRDKHVPAGLRNVVQGDTAALMDLMATGTASKQERDSIHAWYDAGVHYTDERVLGLLINWLREFQLLEETLLVVTGDHGEEMFEHGRLIHTQPYDETSRVPLLIRGPGVPAGLRIPHSVAIVDVMPTVLSLLGLPIPEHVQGRDLSALMRGEAPDRSEVFVDGMLAGKRSGPLAFIEEGDGRRWSYVQIAQRSKGGDYTFTAPAELYDLDADPGQHDDIAAENPEVVARLERRLLERLEGDWQAGLALGLQEEPEESLLSEEEREQLRQLGYVE